MLGTDGRLFDSDFDFDGDGKLNAYEYSVMDDVVFGHEDTETSEVDELEDELSLTYTYLLSFIITVCITIYNSKSHCDHFTIYNAQYQ